MSAYDAAVERRMFDTLLHSSSVRKPGSPVAPSSPSPAVTPAPSSALAGALAGRLSSVESTCANLRATLASRDGEVAALRWQLSEALAAGGPAGTDAAAARRAADARAEITALRAEAEVQRGERAALFAEVASLRVALRERDEFLADYGLSWVGTSGVDAGGATLPSGGAAATTAVPPVTSPPPASPATIDFALLVQRLKELNVLAGEGKARVVSRNGAHQLVAEVPSSGRIPLTLYADGFYLKRGPFRPFSQPTASAFIADICDGFFPQELKDAFPSGVVFDVTDKSRMSYVTATASAIAESSRGGGVTDSRGGGSSGSTCDEGESPSFVPFAGHGNALGGGAARDDRRVTSLAALGAPVFIVSGQGVRAPAAAPAAAAAQVETAVTPAQNDSSNKVASGSVSSARSLFNAPPATDSTAPLSVGALLAALPRKVVAPHGALVDVRGTVAAALSKGADSNGGNGAGAPAAGASTDASVAAAPAPPTDSAAVLASLSGASPHIPASELTFIRVRMDGSGDTSPLLTLRLHATLDTAATLVHLVAAHRGVGGGAETFDLRSAAPPRCISACGPDALLTLRQAGLAPTATLYVRKR